MLGRVYRTIAFAAQFFCGNMMLLIFIDAVGCCFRVLDMLVRVYLLLSGMYVRTYVGRPRLFTIFGVYACLY